MWIVQKILNLHSNPQTQFYARKFFNTELVDGIVQLIQQSFSPYDLRSMACQTLRQILHAAMTDTNLVAMMRPCFSLISELRLYLEQVHLSNTSNLWKRPFVQSVLELLSEAEIIQTMDHSIEFDDSKDEHELKEHKSDEEPTLTPSKLWILAENRDRDRDKPQEPNIAQQSIRWDASRLGPDMVVSEEGRAVTRTTSNGYGCQLGDTWFSSGVTNVDFSIVHSEGTYLYIGVVGRAFNQLDSRLSIANSWCMQADRYLYANSEDVGRGERFGTGDRIRLTIDMNEHKLIISKNETQCGTIASLPSEVTIAVCMGGDNQIVHIVDSQIGSPCSNSARLLQHLVNLRKALQWFEGSGSLASRPVPSWLSTEAQQFLFKPTLSTTTGEASITEDFRVSPLSAGGFPSIVAQGIRISCGRFYYEVTLASEGCMQIGWVDADYVGDSNQGNGVGDDRHSWAYDGYRQLRWYDGSSSWGDKWKVGNVVGCALDMDNRRMLFSLNGVWMAENGVAFDSFEILSNEQVLLPGISMSRGESVQINFGTTPFNHLPAGFRPAIQAMDQQMQNTQQVQQALYDQSEWPMALDLALIRYVNHIVGTRMQKLNSDTVRTMNFTPAAILGVAAEEGDMSGISKHLLSISPVDLRARVAILACANKHLIEAIRLVNMYHLWHAPDQWNLSLARDLIQMRGMFFLDTKLSLWDMAITETMSVRSVDDQDSQRAKPKLNRIRAAYATARQNTSIELIRDTLFGQLWMQLKDRPPLHLRRPQRAFKVEFEGEGAMDVGGPYQEAISHACTDLNTYAVPILIACPNDRNSSGEERNKSILNSAMTSPEELELFEFMGVLIGIALRTRSRIDLDIARLHWKQIVRMPVTIHDLASIDNGAFRKLQMIQNPNQFGINPSDFQRTVASFFNVTLCNGLQVELIDDGNSIPVTYENRFEYVKLASHHLLHEFDVQIEAVQRGIAKIVPAHLLLLFTSAELEFLVCGQRDVDIALLRQFATYDGPSPQDRHVLFLWEVLVKIRFKLFFYFKFVGEEVRIFCFHINFIWLFRSTILHLKKELLF